MEEITFEELKRIELDILLHVASFCEKHGLRYFLAYGTLIGALRHKGFIPWDDDVDIQMPRSDYNEFLRLFNAENVGGDYKVIAPTDKSARHAIAKVIDTRTIKIETLLKYKEPLGVDVDIFPLGGLPEDNEEFENWYTKIACVYRKLFFKSLSPISSNILKNINIIRRKIFIPSREKLLQKAAALHAQYPYETSRYVGTIECAFNGKGNRTLKIDFDDFVVVDFEGYTFRAPVGYDRVLRNIYGDYMSPPPKEKQITHHTNKVYWK
jgi:lipopolysaccharide cholinephosphotransferase